MGKTRPFRGGRSSGARGGTSRHLVHPKGGRYGAAATTSRSGGRPDLGTRPDGCQRVRREFAAEQERHAAHGRGRLRRPEDGQQLARRTGTTSSTRSSRRTRTSRSTSTSSTGRTWTTRSPRWSRRATPPTSRRWAPTPPTPPRTSSTAPTTSSPSASRPTSSPRWPRRVRSTAPSTAFRGCRVRGCSSTTRSSSQHAGITKAPETWSDLATDAKLLKDDGVKVPYGLPLGPEEAQAEALMWMLGADGGGGYTDSVGNYTFDSAANVTALSWVKKQPGGRQADRPHGPGHHQPPGRLRRLPGRQGGHDQRPPDAAGAGQGEGHRRRAWPPLPGQSARTRTPSASPTG